MAGEKRGRIRCAPITRRHGLLTGLPSRLEPLAFTYQYFPQVPDGVLVRVKATGMLCLWTAGAMKTVDQRKANAALSWMIKEQHDAQAGND